MSKRRKPRRRLKANRSNGLDKVRYAPKEIRALVLDRDGYRCRYCSRQVSNKTANMDHVIPWGKGGRTEAWNLVTACRPCNKKKGNEVWEPVYIEEPKREGKPVEQEVLTFTEVDGYMKCDLCSGRVNTGDEDKLRAHKNQQHKTAVLQV